MSDDGGTPYADLHERLQRLEAKHRALRRFAILTVVGLTVAVVALARWVVVSGRSARFKTVEAEHFVVRDSLNEWRGELGMYYGAAIVRLTLGPDDRMTPGIGLGLGKSIRPQLVLRSGNDGPAVRLEPGAVSLDQHFGGRDTYHGHVSFFLKHGVPSLRVIDSSGRMFSDSLRLRY